MRQILSTDAHKEMGTVLLMPKGHRPKYYRNDGPYTTQPRLTTQGLAQSGFLKLRQKHRPMLADMHRHNEEAPVGANKMWRKPHLVTT